jgi:FtsH-binding integral membrane protein
MEAKMMARVARRLTMMTLTMAIFAMIFSHLVTNNQPAVRHVSSGLVASCAPTGLNTCRPTF